MIDRFILDFSKYAVSHVYDIYALLAGTISFVATLLLRKRLKRFGEVMDLLFTIILSLVLYYYFTESSMLIRFNWKYFVLAVMDALGEMYILRAFLKRKKQVVTTAVIFICSLVIAYFYCVNFMSHIKWCYGFKGAMLCLGTIEIIYRLYRFSNNKNEQRG